MNPHDSHPGDAGGLHRPPPRPGWPQADGRAQDGWVGTPEIPGYRAGLIVVRLADLPAVDADHLYFDLLLLDGAGGTADSHSGPCHALKRADPLDKRSDFVRIVAELFRHAADPQRGLAPFGQALAFIREFGVDPGPLGAVAQLLDRAAGEPAVVAQLVDMLVLSLGEEESGEVLASAIVNLARTGALDADPRSVNAEGLAGQVACIVRCVGKSRARQFLREVTDFDLLPRAEMFGR